jgi:hypothetical protein
MPMTAKLAPPFLDLKDHRGLQAKTLLSFPGRKVKTEKTAQAFQVPRVHPVLQA